MMIITDERRSIMKKAMCKMTAAVISLSIVSPGIIPAQAVGSDDTYSCDFTSLIENGTDTMYGTEDDVIVIDEYTTAHLTYEGTYVSADGKVYLKSDTISNKDGRYKNGSYIEFNAPYDGTLTVTGADVGWFEGDTYMGYDLSSPITVTGGNTYYFGYRKDSTYIDSLTYITDQQEPEPTEDTGSDPVDGIYYVSPSTTWDFASEPAVSGNGTPVMSGNAQWNGEEIVFPADTTESGGLSVKMDEPIKNNVSIEFDCIGHTKALGGQFIDFTIENSEEKVVDFQIHPYSLDTSSKGLYICEEQVASDSDIYNSWTAVGTTHVKVDLDYKARKAEVTIGGTSFEAEIPEGTVSDLSKISVMSSRNKTAAERYISIDNLTISEFDSEEEQAPVTVTEGYEEASIAGYSCRVKAQEGKTAVIYLASELRMGNDNVSQLYDAEYLFDKLGDSVTLIAPQTEGVFTDIRGLVDELRESYSAPEVAVIGQSKSVEAALGSGADRVAVIAGSAENSTDSDVWVFAGYNDEVAPVTDMKNMVSRLQLSGVNTRYTEYPFDAHKINEKAADEEGFTDWLINGAEDSRVVDLVLFAGQSNMAGRGDYAESITCAAGKGYEYHAVTEPGVLSSVMEPFGKYENNDNINDNSGSGEDRRSGDMVAALMNAYYDKTGIPMVGVQASRGGQATDYFLSSDVMGEMQSRFNEAAQYLENSGYTVRKKLLVWCQGETDADRGRANNTYKSNTLNIFNQLKESCGISDIFIVRTGHYNINYGLAEGEEPSEDALTKDSEYLRISNAQQELADEHEDIYVVSSLYTDECFVAMRDQYHYYQSVYNSIGAEAGENIAAVYSDEEIPEPVQKNYSWDFETDQTAVSGNNVPVISGTASYDDVNKNIKLDSDTSEDGSVNIHLSPEMNGVVTLEFDMKFAKLSGLVHEFTVKDSSGKAVADIKADVYNSTGEILIDGQSVAKDSEFTQYINSYRGDGINAENTHFKIEINYPKKSVTISIRKDDTTEGVFTGSVSSSDDVSEISISSVHSKYTSGRPSYVDNISISAYMPEEEIYAVGAKSITKRINTTVTEKYEISKTYTDDSEKVEWSVSGVDGVTIDKDTGVLSVPDTAGTGTAKVTAELLSSQTLPVGTKAEIDVEIKDFAKPENYDIDGSSTIEVGKESQFILRSLTDADNNDITEYAVLSGFRSDNTDAAEVSADGTVKAKAAGTAVISAQLTVEKLGAEIDISIPVKTGVYEIESSENNIDVSELISYGSNRYRMYRSDGTYETVTAQNNIIENNAGSAVTVVAEYSLDLTEGGNGTITYSKENGYGLLDGVDYKTNENGSLPADSAAVKLDIPAGFYDITVLRRGGARCDVYAEGIQIINNTTSSASQNRPADTAVMYAPRMEISSGNIDLTIGNTSGSNERIENITVGKVPDKYKKSVIWIAGDSESANYYPVDADGDDLSSQKIMMTGFGMQLDKFLSDEYEVANFGQPSATVKTWYDECFESVLARIQKGDTVLVDFGINDAISSSNKITEDEMKSCMSTMIEALKEKGALPILVSPVYNNKYQGRSYFTFKDGSNDMYEFASENGVACIDLNKGTQKYNKNASETSGDPGWTVNNYHVNDNLHLTQHSAIMAAAIIAGGMNELGYKTTDYSYIYSDISSVEDTNRGAETGVTREYSISALKDYITVEGDKTSVPTPGPTESIDGMKAVMECDGSEMRIKSNDSGLKSAVLSAVSYNDDGTLKSLKLYNSEFTDNESVMDIDAENGTVFYLWDDMDNMTPLAKSITYIVQTVTTSNPEESTPEPTSTPTPVPTAEPTPGTLIYSQDFEEYSEGSNGGWESSAGKVEVKNDTSDGIGKYMTVVSGKSGTCRSGLVELPEAVTENFVFECDFKSNSYDNVSELQLVEKKNSIYMNHGVYSNANYALTLDRPRSENFYVINNGRSDSGLSFSAYNTPAVTTKEIEGDPWLHIKAVGNFDTHTIILYVTSLDQKTEYYRGMVNMSPGLDSWECIHLLSPSTGIDTCIDNIKVYSATEHDLSPEYHNVTITCKSYSFDQYVENGRSVINIPDVSLYGEYFDGWSINGGSRLYTSEELASVPITSDSTITGVVNDGYIENMASVDFSSYPAANELVMGADENTYGDNIISLSIVGEQGTSLVTSPDSRVTDYNIEWEFKGFRILDGRPTGETGNVYCDSYGLCEVTEKAQTSVNFKLKRTSANYYGTVTAKVTYNGKTIEVSRPLVLLGDKNNNSGNILPAAGYESDYNKYDTALYGYTFTDADALFGNWKAEGSDSKRYMFLSDETGSYIRLIRDAVGNSVYGYNEIGDITTQTIFEQDIRFNADGNIQYTGGSPTSISSAAFILSMESGKLKFNGKEICSASNGEWYHVEICADPTVKKTWAKVYNEDKTEMIGESGTVDFEDSDYSGGKYYRISPEKTRNGSIDFNNVIIRAEEVSEIEVTAPETVQIPESGENTVDITVNAVTVDGNEAMGLAVWKTSDEYADGVSIESSGEHSARIRVESSAPSGDMTFEVTIGGKTKEFTVKLLGTKDNIAFVAAPAGVMIPQSGSADYEFSAVVRNGMAEDIPGRKVVYNLYNESNTEETQIDGITLNNGVLTVSNDAKPQDIYIHASTEDGSITRFVKVSVYNLKFDFKGGTEGYTYVNSQSYSDSLGYGVDSVKSDSEFTFKVKLEKGKVYAVNAVYNGTIKCERIDGFSDGFERSRESIGEDSYKVAVFGDDIMDITVSGQLDRLEIIPVEKIAGALPDWWTIGDSTVQQNGSWGYTIASSATSDFSRYPALIGVIGTFHNSGRAGRQYKNYYSEGLLNDVLCNMNPGDVVSISGMGVNDSSSTLEQFKMYDEIYMNAVMDMGGYVILGSYTPSGNYGATEGKVYDADTMTFRGMRTDSYDRAIREVYKENRDNEKILGFIDIGKLSDDKMTEDVREVYNQKLPEGEEAAREAANERAAQMMAWWKDYNHYYTDFSNYILPEITEGVADLVKQRG